MLLFVLQAYMEKWETIMQILINYVSYKLSFLWDFLCYFMKGVNYL